MKKGLLTYCACLAVCIALAQGESVIVPAVQYTGMDSVSFITDLTSLVRDNSKVVINWTNSERVSAEYVMVERSSSGRPFEMIAVLKQPGHGKDFEWVDDAPGKGRNLYRLRFDGADGQPYYSKVVTALIAGDISFRLYPNPVDNILILRSESALDIQIFDASGKIRLTQTRLQGIETINVSTLEKGIYYLRIHNRTTGITMQERLLKN